MKTELNKIDLRNWAWENCLIDGDTTTLLVALALVEYTFADKGFAHVGNAKLAAKTGLADRTITRSINKLEEAGAWRVERSTGHASTFYPVLTFTATPDTQSPLTHSHPRQKVRGPLTESRETPDTESDIKGFNTGITYKEQETLPAIAASTPTDEDPFAPYQPEPATRTVKKEKRTKKAATEVSSHSSFAWATVEKCQSVSGGLVRNRKQLHDLIVTAIEQGGHDREQVAATCFAISAAQKAVTLQFLYDVLNKRRNADGTFINKTNSTGNRPGMPLNADVRPTPAAQMPQNGHRSHAEALSRVRPIPGSTSDCARLHDHTERCEGYELNPNWVEAGAA